MISIKFHPALIISLSSRREKKLGLNKRFFFLSSPSSSVYPFIVFLHSIIFTVKKCLFSFPLLYSTKKNWEHPKLDYWQGGHFDSKNNNRRKNFIFPFYQFMLRWLLFFEEGTERHTYISTNTNGMRAKKEKNFYGWKFEIFDFFLFGLLLFDDFLAGMMSHF